MSKQQMMEYQQSLKRYNDYKNTMDFAKNEAFKEGLQKGELLGLQKGEQLGLQKGQQSIALKMLNQELPLSLISELTGLSSDEIKQLKDK